MPGKQTSGIKLDYYTFADTPLTFVRLEHPDLRDEFLTMLFFEHNEIPPEGSTLDEFREFFNRIGSYSQNDDGTVVAEQDMWTLKFIPAADAVDLELRVRNKTDRDWHDLVSVTGCVSPLGWGVWRLHGVPRDESPYAAPTFADRETRDKTYISTEDGPFLLASRAKHFFDQQTLDRVLALPYKTNVFRVEEHKAAPPFVDRGIIVRCNRENGWVLGYGWEDTLCVNANNPLDCLHPTVRIGPLKAGSEKMIRGKVYLFQGTIQDAFDRYDGDLK